MKRLASVVLMATLALGLGACKKSKDQVAEDAVKMMESIGQIAEKHKGDCDKMGSELDKLVTSKKKLIEEMKKMKGDKESNKKYEEKYGDRMKAATKKMMGGMIKCATNKKVKDAMKKMR
jgi:ATP-dependent helicase YprA (DUF1998 family)